MKALALLSAIALFGLTSGSPVSRRDIQEITETTVDFGNLRLQYTFFQRAFAMNVSAYIHDDDVDQRTSKFVDNLNDAVGLQSSKNAWYLDVTQALPSMTVNVGIGYSNADEIVAQDTWEVINRFIVDTSEHSATACARIWIPSDCNDGDPAKCNHVVLGTAMWSHYVNVHYDLKGIANVCPGVPAVDDSDKSKWTAGPPIFRGKYATS